MRISGIKNFDSHKSVLLVIFFFKNSPKYAPSHAESERITQRTSQAWDVSKTSRRESYGIAGRPGNDTQNNTGSRASLELEKVDEEPKILGLADKISQIRDNQNAKSHNMAEMDDDLTLREILVQYWHDIKDLLTNLMFNLLCLSGALVMSVFFGTLTLVNQILKPGF